MRFIKMQGAGNDFVVLDNDAEGVPAALLPELARRLCRRKLGLGADGLMVVERPQAGADLRMVFYNNDGSEGEMCGNAARCITRYGLERGFAHGDTVSVETASGTVRGKAAPNGLYTVRLNDPTRIDPYRTVTVDGKDYDCAYVELGIPGHPHAVVPLDFQSWEENALRELGRSIRWDRGFPKGANVTFCTVTGEDQVSARTFERGVEDFTLACGTGCGSTVTALTLRGLVSGQNVRVSVPGGDLYVTAVRQGERVTDLYLTGPAVTVAEGEIRDPAVLELLK